MKRRDTCARFCTLMLSLVLSACAGTPPRSAAPIPEESLSKVLQLASLRLHTCDDLSVAAGPLRVLARFEADGSVASTTVLSEAFVGTSVARCYEKTLSTLRVTATGQPFEKELRFYSGDVLDCPEATTIAGRTLEGRERHGIAGEELEELWCEDSGGRRQGPGRLNKTDGTMLESGVYVDGLRAGTWVVPGCELVIGHMDSDKCESDDQSLEVLSKGEVLQVIKTISLSACSLQYGKSTQHIRVAFEIGSNGTVVNAYALDPQRAEVEECICDAVRNLKFRATSRFQKITFPFEL